MEILKLSKNYRYRKMHQILADNLKVSQTNFCAVSQQTVIKKDPLVPYDDANYS